MSSASRAASTAARAAAVAARAAVAAYVADGVPSRVSIATASLSSHVRRGETRGCGTVSTRRFGGKQLGGRGSRRTRRGYALSSR